MKKQQVKKLGRGRRRPGIAMSGLPSSKPSVKRPIMVNKTHKIQQAINLLGNNRKHPRLGGVLASHVKTALDKGDLKVTEDNYFDPEAMALAGSLVDMNTVYEFRIVSAGISLTASAGGVLASYQTADPSGGGTWTATEWASLVTLFSEVKMKRFTCHFVRALNTGIAAGQGIAVSGVLSTVAAAPTTYSQVYDNADANVYNLLNDTSLHGYKHTIKGTDLTWAIVTTPNPGSYAGCPGSIQWYGNGITINSTVGQVHISGHYLFRSRI